MFLLKKELRGHKPFFIILQKLHGVGKNYALYLCSRIGVSVKCFLDDVDYAQGKVLNRLVTLEGIFEMELTRFMRDNIKLKIQKRCYEGRRHFVRLPVRGQNTKNNRKTARKLLSVKR